ncbi:hypothetical protein CK203_068126 [Vitis vinifera]|uniref:Uncharacterized protein n=1 Tax=Vitis vinifera TaxID=29760 RepID=A0A438E1T0_VITVI|nr:hypothetical protein CK203_068126 [Vitis vinifera]
MMGTNDISLFETLEQSILVMQDRHRSCIVDFSEIDPQFCPPSTCPIRYLFDTLQ